MRAESISRSARTYQSKNVDHFHTVQIQLMIIAGFELLAGGLAPVDLQTPAQRDIVRLSHRHIIIM